MRRRLKKGLDVPHLLVEGVHCSGGDEASASDGAVVEELSTYSPQLANCVSE
jgi:hypothetical protein